MPVGVGQPTLDDRGPTVGERRHERDPVKPSGRAAIFGALTIVALSILIGSTVFFHYQEGWALDRRPVLHRHHDLDGRLWQSVPATDLGKIKDDGADLQRIGALAGCDPGRRPTGQPPRPPARTPERHRS